MNGPGPLPQGRKDLPSPASVPARFVSDPGCGLRGQGGFSSQAFPPQFVIVVWSGQSPTRLGDLNRVSSPVELGGVPERLAHHEAPQTQDCGLWGQYTQRFAAIFFPFLVIHLIPRYRYGAVRCGAQCRFILAPSLQPLSKSVVPSALEDVKSMSTSHPQHAGLLWMWRWIPRSDMGSHGSRAECRGPCQVPPRSRSES